nr:kinase/pyrophosphorylase [Brachymonas sp.]
MTQQHAHQRTVFFVSDGTGITAETFGNAILNQFEFQQPLRHVRLPFVSDMDKARQAVQQINQTADAEGKRPIVFSTLVNDDILWL